MNDLVLRYPPAALAGDYTRAGIGLALTAGPLALLPVHPTVAIVLGMVAALFGGFLALTARRHMTRFRVGDEGITADGPLGGGVRWSDMDGLVLKYYSTRRDRTDGWMEMRIASRTGSITVDSSLPEFDGVAARAAIAAKRNGLALPPATVDNLAALGIDAGPPSGRPGCDR